MWIQSLHTAYQRQNCSWPASGHGCWFKSQKFERDYGNFTNWFCYEMQVGPVNAERFRVFLDNLSDVIGEEFQVAVVDNGPIQYAEMNSETATVQPDAQ